MSKLKPQIPLTSPPFTPPITTGTLRRMTAATRQSVTSKTQLEEGPKTKPAVPVSIFSTIFPT
jgi:hypothetical protein